MLHTLSLTRPPHGWRRLLAQACEAEDFQYGFSLLEDTDPGALRTADAVVAGAFGEEQIRSAENLKFLQVPFAGTDKIDLKHLKNRGIPVANAHENASSVAEHGMLLLLSLTKNLINQDRDLRKGIWHGWVAREPGTEAQEKTLGIIGLGSIGSEMARRARCFGMRVIGTRANPDKGREKSQGIIDAVYAPKELDTVIKKSHYIFVSVPLTPATRAMIGSRELALMKGKYLINISRGDVIDEAALYAALKNGNLKGAAIDTWYAYPQEGTFGFPSRYPFHTLSNVIMTPHAAGFTAESMVRNWQFSFRNIARFFRTGRAENLVAG